MQITFMTPQAISLAIRKTKMLISIKSTLRVAALAQQTPFAGSWKVVRFDWSDEPERIANFCPHLSPNSHL